MAGVRKRKRDDTDVDNDHAEDIEVDGDDSIRHVDSTPLPAGARPQADAKSPPEARPAGVGQGQGPGGTSSSFRNVSACNRCRHRKNRCDQKLPRCSACVKADARCVGFDPVSKRQIPRSYVYFLEKRLRSLEELLLASGIAVPAPEEDFAIGDDFRSKVNVLGSSVDEGDDEHATLDQQTHPSLGGTKVQQTEPAIDPALRDSDERVDQARRPGLNINNNQKNPRKAAPLQTSVTSDITFSKVVIAAVRTSVTQTPSERSSNAKDGKLPTADSHRSHIPPQDSFFGLFVKTSYKPAQFPDKELGRRLVDLYFEHANPQIPTLHRGCFMALFEKVYAKPQSQRTARELFLLRIVFAIGSGIIMDSSARSPPGESPHLTPKQNKQRLETHQYQPEEYHAAAVIHLESFLSASTAMEGHGGGLEEVQAVLLLAAFALLRPVAPGLWYIVGVAVRLGVDLGLHIEDVDPELDAVEVKIENEDQVTAPQTGKLGVRQWTRDLRRRLWWCVYSFDRLVSTCVGRPFGISDQVVTTEFPSLLDDQYITTTGFLRPSSGAAAPTYKHVSRHYFRLRLLQSEILQVLQYRQAQQARAMGANSGNAYMHTRLPSPFLQRFASFRDWRADVDRRLREWKDSAPKKADIGVSFTPLFLELNYWQAIIVLYRQSLSVPAALAEELSISGAGEEVQTPGTLEQEVKQDEQLVFMKAAEAGQMVLKTYRQLHRLKLVNYTFLATHHLFMCGISFLYALWHSPLVRSQLTLDDVDFTILAATSVLTDLIEKCPPAEACRDAFGRMSKATITMCMNTTGFGNASDLESYSLEPISMDTMPKVRTAKKTVPAFDMDLKGLLSDEGLTKRPDGEVSPLMSLSSTPDIMHQPSYRLSNTQVYAPLAESIERSQLDTPFDSLDFLDTFPVADPNQQFWGLGNELDFGFFTGSSGSSGGTNGGYEAWGDLGTVSNVGGVDLFDGFFFGTGNGGL